MKHMLLATVAAVAILSSAALGQTLPQGVQKGPSMGGITEYDFPHGLTVLLYPDPANPKVTVDVTYTVGSRHEGYGETGMAHLLGTSGTPLKVAAPRNPLYDAFLRLTIAALEGVSVSNSLMRTGINL